MINKIAELILRLHGGFVAGIILLTVILFFWFIRIEMGSTYSGMFPPMDDPERVFLLRTRADLGSNHALLIAIRHDNLFSVPTLTKIDKLTSTISEYPAIDHVLSLTNANILRAKDDEIYLQNIAGKVPTSEQEVEQFRKDIFQYPLYAGNLVSKDGKTTVITVAIDTSYPNEVFREAVEQIQTLALAAAEPEEIYITGTPVINQTITKMMASDLSTYVPLTLLIIAIILFINFRSWWCVLASLLLAFIAVEWTYSSMAFFGVPIYILTAVIPPIIAALGISYSVHLFTEYSRQSAVEGDPRRIIKHTIQNTLLAIWLSTITTAIGFACLFAVGVVAIREFSMFLVIGVASLLILITFFVPSMLIYIQPKRRTNPNVNRHRWDRTSSGFIDWIVRYRYCILIFAALVIAPGVLGLFRIKVETDIYEFFKPSAPIRQASDVITDDLHGANIVDIVITGEREGAMEDPSLLKSIEALQSYLDRLPYVGKTRSMVDYLKIINKAFHNNNPDYHVLPNNSDEISQYLLIYSLADPSRTLDRYIDYDHRIAKISTTSIPTSSASIMEFKHLIEDQCSKLLPPSVSCKPTGSSVLFAISAKNISEGILLSFGLAASVISIVMFILFRSLKMGVIAMIPNFIPLLSILALMGWAGIDFNIGTSIVICLAIGIAVDDTIHFLTRYFHELKRTNHYLIRRYTNLKITADQMTALRVTFNRVRRPIILTSVVVFCGFMILIFSQFVPIVHLGWLTALTMVFCLICDLILLPAILASVSI